MEKFAWAVALKPGRESAPAMQRAWRIAAKVRFAASLME
jgi:hypothetical protein